MEKEQPIYNLHSYLIRNVSLSVKE